MAFLPGLAASLIFRHAVADADSRQAIETLSNFSLVCKHWQQLIESDEAEDERLWRPIAKLLSPAFPDDLASLSYWNAGDKPSWRAACKLHCGWTKAFVAPIPMFKVHPHISEELCDIDMPPVPHSCRRVFVLAVSVHTSHSPFLVQQRISAHLPQLNNSLISFNYRTHHIRVLTHDRGPLHVECTNLFPGIDGHCKASSHHLKALHIRKVCISHLPMIFAASEECLLLFDDDDDDDGDEDDDVGNSATANDDRATFSANDDSATFFAIDGSATFTATHEQGLAHDVSDAKEGNSGNAVDSSEDVFVVHNVLGNLTCDIWVVHDEPFFCTYWQKLLVYCPKSLREIVTCVEAGIDGVELWCTAVNASCNHMEVNSRYVAVLGPGHDEENFFTRLLLLSIQNGETLKFVNMKFTVTSDMLLTDTCVVVNLWKVPVTVFQLPGLEALYALPFPNGQDPASVGFMALSPCGKYLGLSAGFGSFVLYDMLLGNVKYFGSNGVGLPKECKRQLGGGVWLWYKDVKSEDDIDGRRRKDTEKILFWELTEPDPEFYELLSRF